MLLRSFNYTSRHSDLVIAVLSNIANPRKRMVSTLFLNFEITYLESTNCIIWNFEIHWDWKSLEFFSIWWNNGRQSESSSHHILSLARESLKTPSHGFLFRNIGDCTVSSFENGSLRIIRNGNEYFDIVCSRFLLEITLDLDSEFNLVRIRLSFSINFNRE